jgi:hypothetical protein
MKKRGELQLSFGMIFSIILIIAFLAFAFYAIRIFLSMSDKTKIAKFRDDIQSDIDKVWRAAQATQKVEYMNIPTNIEEICFANDQTQNLRFFPEDAVKNLGIVNLKNINLTRTTSSQVNSNIITRDGTRMLCFDNAKGKIKLNLTKSFNENLVTIRR